MNYPVWYLPEIGGGTLIALIAIVHVFISHFAVGGGLYLVLAEQKGLKENSQPIMDFTYRHARFFLLLTMVLGSITGVGIWFIIALVNPAATSYLIHNFVFGWAAEWVFFMVEIAAAFVYFYFFGKMDSRSHLQVGYLYFFAAWMSLFLINGIIGAMLTPGGWAETGDFWQGFFNPSFWPSLVFRTFVSILLAGCYGYLSASNSKDAEVRRVMTRFSAGWSLVALVGVAFSGFWYLSILPGPAAELVAGKSPTITSAMEFGLVGIALVLGITLIFGLLKPGANNRLVALIALAGAFVSMGAFEWSREAARRPFVINELIYSNSIFKNDIPRLTQEGFLQNALWVSHKEVTEENLLQVGEELFIQQCYSCHTLGGANNDLAVLTENMSYGAMRSYLDKIHSIRYFMPPFAGNSDEADALAAYLISGVHGKEIMRQVAEATLEDNGSQLFETHCSVCHEVEDIQANFEGEELATVIETLGTLNEISDEMEPFTGNDNDKTMLSSFLLQIEEQPVVVQPAISGETLYENNCMICHEPDVMQEYVSGMERDEIYETLGQLDEISDEMEPFEGTDEERNVLADFLADLQGENR